MYLPNQTELEQADFTLTYRRNITKGESEANTSLKNNSTIVIRLPRETNELNSRA